MMNSIEVQSALRQANLLPEGFSVEVAEFLKLDRSYMTNEQEREVLFALIRAHLKSHNVVGI